MGLDQYALKIKNIDGLTDFNFPDYAVVDMDFDYWRKFYGLQIWMENLYREKGGSEVMFNCTPIRLTMQDLERLDRDSEEDEFYEDRIFETLEEEKADKFKHLKQFIKKAKKAMAEGYVVYYDSWW